VRAPWPQSVRQPALAAAARSLLAVAGRRRGKAGPRPGRTGGAGAPGSAVAAIAAAAAFCRRRREKGDESKVHQINSVVNVEDSEYKAAAMSRKHSFIGVMYRTKCEVNTRKFIQIGSMQVEC